MSTAPSPSPLAAMWQAFADLTVAVEQLPFAGVDQRVRAEQGLDALRRQLVTCQVGQ